MSKKRNSRKTTKPGKKQSSAALEILRERYIGGDVRREKELDEARLGASIAQEIYALRTRAGLTQQGLARLVGTSRTVITRLEDSSYEGHSLSMLQRIANALGVTLRVQFIRNGKKPSA